MRDSTYVPGQVLRTRPCAYDGEISAVEVVSIGALEIWAQRIEPPGAAA